MGILIKMRGMKIYNYVATWVRTPYDGSGMASWSLVQGVKSEDQLWGWWSFNFGGVEYLGFESRMDVILW